MKKSNWTFTSRLVLSCGCLIASLILYVVSSSSYSILSAWDWVYAIIYIAVPVLLIVYAVGQTRCTGKLKQLYIIAMGIWALMWIVLALQDLRGFSVTIWIELVFYLRNFAEVALYVVIFLCCTAFRQRLGMLKRAGNVLLLVVAVLCVLECGVYVFFNARYLLDFVDQGAALLSIVMWLLNIPFRQLMLLLIDVAVWLLLPTALMNSVSADSSDMEAQLLQLKENYENGYMSQKEYLRLQKALLEKL